MPPPASHRLAVLVLAADPDADGRSIADLAAAWALLAAAGGLVTGGHGSMVLEGDGPVRFLANRQGGFRVTCPDTGTNVVGAFVPALTGWRAGGPRGMRCPCGGVHDLAALVFAPEAGFARAWITISDVASADLAPRAAQVAKDLLGEVRVVLRRG